MAAYSDTVESDANAEAPVVTALKSASKDVTEQAEVRSSILSTQLGASVDVEDDANGADLHFQFDSVMSDANADTLLVNERRDLLTTVEATARGAASVLQQTRHLVEPILIVGAQGQDTAVRAGRAMHATVQSDANAEASIITQTRVASASIVADAEASPVVVSSLLRASDTIVADAEGEDGEPNFFVDSAHGDSSVVRATLHVRDTFTEAANAQAVLVSTALRQRYRDTVEASAQGEGSIESALLSAYQEVINDVDAVDEVLNVLSEEAWVFNTWTLAFSRYTGLGVNDAADVGGVPLFTKPTGLQEFSDTDFSDALVQFGLNNMGSMSPKRMRAIYVTTTGKGVVKLATFHGLAGALQEAKYATPVRESAVPINRRISPARGHRGQYWGFRVEVTEGRQTVTRIHVLPLVTGRNL